MYDVYIDGVLLPIAPEKITTQINGRNETVNLINDNEVNILKAAGLTTISLPVLLPNSKYPFARYPSGFKMAGYYLDKLAALKSSKKPFQFIVTRHFPTNKKLFNTNITCSLENYQIVDDAKNGFDIEVQINLKQFKSYSTKTFTAERPSPTAPVVVNPNRPASTSSGGGNNGGGGSGGKTGGGSSKKTYKVQIPGMSVLSIKASSVQDAISKAMGTSWTGTVYVNGTSYYVSKGKISQKPATKAKTPSVVQKVKNAVKTTVNKVKTTVKKVKKTVTNVVNNVLGALKKAASKKKTTPKKPTPPKKKVTVNRRNRMVMKN